MKQVAFVTILVMGIVTGAPTDQEHVSGPNQNEAAEERILDLGRKSRQLFGSAFGYYPYSNGINQGVGGYPYSYNSASSGYSGLAGYPYQSNGVYNAGYSNGLAGNGIYSGGLSGNGLYSNGGYTNGLGYNNGFNPLAGGYNSAQYNGGQPLFNDPYNSPIASRGFFPGSPFYRRPY